MKDFRVYYTYQGRSGSFVLPASDSSDAYSKGAEKLEDAGMGDAHITSVEERQVNNMHKVKK